MKELLSVFVKDDILYLAERVDGKVDIRTEKYDSPIQAAYNMPTSRDITLPTDQVELDQYALSSFSGQYDFEYQPGEPNGYLTYDRIPSIHKDVYTCHGLIVHVQDYEPKTATDKVFDEILDTFKYQDHDPVSFIDMVNEKLGKAGIDLEKEVESMVFEQPKEEEATPEVQ
jgi:hypothetical protein